MSIEILLGSKCYTKGVDMWAVGTILGEMINGRPIFPGTSTMNQIERILEVTHIPTTDDIQSIQSPFASTMLATISEEKTLVFKSYHEAFPAAAPDAMDLIKACFRFNPNTRPTAVELLRHPYSAEFHNEDEEPNYPRGSIGLIVDDNIKLTSQQYREQLYQEIANRRREARKRDPAYGEGLAGNEG
jgi:mitogen-activated protein kinase 15